MAQEDHNCHRSKTQRQQQKNLSGMHQITPSEVADIVHINTVSQHLPKSYKQT